MYDSMHITFENIITVSVLSHHNTFSEAISKYTSGFQDCTFSPKFDEHVENLKEMHRHINIIYGYSTSYGKHKGDPIAEVLREGFECLKDFCKESNVSLVELFQRFDADNSMSVSLQEFQEGLKVRHWII